MQLTFQVANYYHLFMNALTVRNIPAIINLNSVSAPVFTITGKMAEHFLVSLLERCLKMWMEIYIRL